MPTYEYACTSCDHRFETVQSFSDPSLTTCPACGGTLRKVFGNVGIVLKGSGFYKTDSRSTSNGAAKTKERTKEGTESSSSSSSSSSESSAKSEGTSTKESSSSPPASSSTPEKAAASTGS